MNIENINYKKVDKLELSEQLIKGDVEKPLKKQLKELLDKFEIAINLGDYLVARNMLLVSIYFQNVKTLDVIKRKGLFRYSKYINRKCIVKEIASELISIYKLYGFLTDEIESYLNSIINYSSIINSYESFNGFVLKEIKEFEKKYTDKSLIKTLLSYADFLFLSNYFPKTRDDLSNISNRTKENVCSAISFLIYFYTEKIKDKEVDINFVAEEYITSGDIQKLIMPVCYLLDFKEFEVLIDHFGYYCEKHDKKLIIKPPFEDFEKSIRLGYIKTDLQQINDKIDTHDAVSFEEFVDEINKKSPFQFVKLIDTHNYSRYRLEIPEPFYDLLIERFIKPDALFKEEIRYLSSIFKEQLLNLDDLEKIQIRDDLTLSEFMKIRRTFLIFYLFFAKEIYKKEKVESKLLLRSLIPVLSKKSFYEFIEKLLPTIKIDSFLDIVCWEPGLDVLFDLQYHPILFFDDYFLIPLSIFSNSNSIRNLYASEYKKNNVKLLSDGGIDPLVNKLCSSLNHASLECHTETPVGYTDIDVFAIYENVLFVFECKHSLHPVSSFDLRTTYDYIKKAEKQLDLIIDDFNSGNLIKKLEKKHNIKLNYIEKIQGVVILSNRLFNGNIFRYPVRNINELENILLRGTIKTENGIFWLWKEKKLTVDFLIDYFSLTNELVQIFYDSLSKRTLTYKFANPIIEYNTYSLEMKIAIPNLKKFTDKLELKSKI